MVLQLPILFALYQALIRASGVISGFTVNDGNRAAFNTLEAAGVIAPVSGVANTFQVAIDGPCNLPEYSQLPQFLPLNCQLIDPVKLTDHVDTTVGWLFNIDLARVDHVFAITLFGGFAISLMAVIAAILQFVQVKMTSAKPNPDDPTAGVTSTMLYTFPLLTIVWGGIFPSGLILYWIVYTAYLVLQQYLIMGWGNLFPLFGWSPSWAPQTDDAPVPRPARVETDAADAAAKPSNPGGSASSANRSAARGASGRQNRPRRRGKKR